MLTRLVPPLANGVFETKDFFERAGPVSGTLAAIGGLLAAYNSPPGDRIENGGWGALAGGLLGIALTAGGLF